MTRGSIPSQSDILLAFSVETDLSEATLHDYLHRYPQYGAALAELAVELMIAPHRDEAICTPDDPAVERAWLKYQTAANALETKSLGMAGSLLAALPPAEFKKVAYTIGGNTLFLAQLRDRMIDLATIPKRLIAQLATELATTVDAITDDLAQPSMLASAERFSADHKPAPATKISFETALSQSGLDDAQQTKLKAYMD